MKELPDWIPIAPWDAFVAMRKKQKKPMTEGALARMINKLDALRTEGQDLTAVLNQSEDKCWLDVFPVHDRRATQRQSPTFDNSRLGKHGQATANNALDWLEGK